MYNICVTLFWMFFQLRGLVEGAREPSNSVLRGSFFSFDQREKTLREEDHTSRSLISCKITLFLSKLIFLKTKEKSTRIIIREKEELTMDDDSTTIVSFCFACVVFPVNH